MTLLDLVTRLRSMLEDTGGRGVDWTSSTNAHLLKWTNEELTQYLNIAEREMARRTLCLIDSTTTSVTRLNIRAGTSLYKLHPSILSIERFKLSAQHYAMDHISYKDLGTVVDWETDVGTPSYYITDLTTGYARLVPIPVVADTASLTVYRLPLRDLDWTQNDLSPEIAIPYHDSMIYYAAHLAYEKDEPNTIDKDRSMYMLNKFTELVGPSTSIYSVERKKRPKRTTGYGGIL